MYGNRCSDAVSYEMTTRHEQNILALMQRTGCEILQENGQRKFGPHPDWQGPPPPKGCEIFMGHLPRNVFEDELVPLFERVGPIYQLRLMMDFSGTSRGYGFVEYSCPEHARRAVAELNNFEIKPNKRIGVVMSKDNCRLFVGKIPKDKSREEILDEMRFHTMNVEDVIVHPSFKDNTKNRGYAFVEYTTHRDAAMARRKLLPGKFRLFGCEVQVDWAEPEPEVDPETMSRVTNLYVRNVHPDVESEEHLAILFSFAACRRSIGKDPLRVTKAKKMKDFAFIHYATREEAEIGIELAWADKYFGRELSTNGTRLDVTWAKPPDRLQKSRKNFRFHQGDGYQMMRQYPDAPFRPNRTDWNRQSAFELGSQGIPFPMRRPSPHPEIRLGERPESREFDRGRNSIFSWASQSSAGGDLRAPPSHSSGLWSTGMGPYGMPSPAASPVMMRAQSPFIHSSSPNPFANFALRF